MGKNGAKVWFFPDGYLPEKLDVGDMEAHEALMLFNTGDASANVKLDFYFEDKEPVKDIPVTVGKERVLCLHLDRPDDIDGLSLPPLLQYALRVRSDVEIVVQFCRLDTTQANMSYYVAVGYCTNEE